MFKYKIYIRLGQHLDKQHGMPTEAQLNELSRTETGSVNKKKS